VQLSGFFSRRERSSDILTEETALEGNKNMFKDKRYRTSESLFADLTIEITLRSKSQSMEPAITLNFINLILPT
jgi:hypothetical protein